MGAKKVKELIDIRMRREESVPSQSGKKWDNAGQQGV